MVIGLSLPYNRTAMDRTRRLTMAALGFRSPGEKEQTAFLSESTVFVVKIAICATLVAFAYGLLIVLFAR